MTRRSSGLENVDLLGIAPVRVAEWEESEGRVTVKRPRPAAGGLRGLAEILSFWMSVPRIRLDELGSFCWKQFDGRRTVGQVAEALRAEFGEQVDPAEERVGHFVRVLRYQGMLAYPGWDPVPDPRGQDAVSRPSGP